MTFSMLRRLKQLKGDRQDPLFPGKTEYGYKDRPVLAGCLFFCHYFLRRSLYVNEE